LTDWARQMLLQLRRWLPKRSIYVVADSSYAVIELLDAVRAHVHIPGNLNTLFRRYLDT
jgi:hypothetical protein